MRMTIQDLYDWAFDNHCENSWLEFKTTVGSQEVEFDIKNIQESKFKFSVWIELE